MRPPPKTAVRLDRLGRSYACTKMQCEMSLGRQHVIRDADGCGSFLKILASLRRGCVLLSELDVV